MSECKQKFIIDVSNCLMHLVKKHRCKESRSCNWTRESLLQGVKHCSCVQELVSEKGQSFIVCTVYNGNI